MDTNLKIILQELNREGIWLQDMLGLLAGIRPMIRFALDRKKYYLLKELGSKEKIKMVIYEYPSIKIPTVLIGKNLPQLKKAEIYDKAHDFESLGFLLGYPDCCIRRFMNQINGMTPCEKINYPLYTYESTVRKEKLNFLLNYLYNFDTRIKTFEFDNVGKLSQKGYYLWNAHIIPHIPCSFECRKSILFANKIWHFLDKYFPSEKEKMEYYLKRPILFINDYEFIPFIGRANQNSIVYRGYIDSKNFVGKITISAIANGNRILIRNNHVVIMKNKKIMHTIKRMATIFNFN